MKINLDCIPCSVKQTLSTARSLDLADETTRDLGQPMDNCVIHET